MIEYKTLDQWFPNGRGDGRKFIDVEDLDTWFEPIFRSHLEWFGLNSFGNARSVYHRLKWKEWHEPKKTKIVTLYKPVLRVYDNHYRACHVDEWHTDKNSFDHIKKTIVGWLSQEVEVECD